MPTDWCGLCNGAEQAHRTRTGEYGLQGGATKQDLLDEICVILGVPREPVGRGSSLPSSVFAVAAARTGVGQGSMPEIGEMIAADAGLAWGPDCDSRGTVSEGGSTVTREGLSVVLRALEKLLGRPAGTAR